MKGVFVIVVVFLIGFSYAYTNPFDDIMEPIMEELRQKQGGIIEILKSFATLLRAIVGILDGSSSAKTLVSAMQGVFFSIERTINLQGLVMRIPIVGRFIAPVIGGITTVIGNTPMLSGLIEQVL
ncbi:unnamed protein product [Phyllotreta striolata]|uniref:Uncharacterized protein n=1 Tax=Phyllotreta striolata TaxID=444603 RepID=A0A9N9TN68_PHYSR|nr:unnamed protein product [Phyllotreta striolata]